MKEGKRSAELEDALQWLVDAGLLIKTELVEKPEIPLEGAADRGADAADVGGLQDDCRLADGERAVFLPRAYRECLLQS